MSPADYVLAASCASLGLVSPHLWCHSRSGPRGIDKFRGWAKAGIGSLKLLPPHCCTMFVKHGSTTQRSSYRRRPVSIAPQGQKRPPRPGGHPSTGGELSSRWPQNKVPLWPEGCTRQRAGCRFMGCRATLAMTILGELVFF